MRETSGNYPALHFQSDIVLNVNQGRVNELETPQACRRIISSSTIAPNGAFIGTLSNTTAYGIKHLQSGTIFVLNAQTTLERLFC